MSKKRKATSVAFITTLVVAVPGGAFAAPAFGPGNNGGGEGNLRPAGSQVSPTGPNNHHSRLQVGR